MANNPRDKPHHGGQSGKPAEQHHGSTAEETRALNETLKSFSEKYYEPDEKKDRRERVKFRLEIGLAVGVALNILLTIGLLIANSFQASYSGGQVTASQDQVRVTQDQEHRQLRAYVGVSPKGIENFGQPEQFLRIIRKNYGVTPAYDLFMDRPNIDVKRTNERFFPALCWPVPPAPVNTLTLFPGQELRFEIHGQTLTKEQIDLVRNGGQYAVLYWGTLHYKDAFNELHCTRYCWDFKGANMAEADTEYCAQHNDAY